MINIADYKNKVEETVGFLKTRVKNKPAIVVILGTGLGGFIESMAVDTWISYDEIPNFPRSTVPGHRGNLICGTISGKNIAALQGRFHFYEGYSTRELTFPLRVLSLLGAKILIVTNAAGGLDASLSPGTMMIIRDHLNFIGENPLRGPNVQEWGPRFPDLSEPYDTNLIETTLQCAAKLRLDNITTGIYAAIPGPSLETPAETRFFRKAGADCIGMSSVPEVIVARHAGMRVLGLSAIANINDPDNFAPILLDDVIAAAEKIEPDLQKLIREVLQTI